MTRKDVTYLVLAIIILAATGIAAYLFLVPKSATKSNASIVEVIAPVNPSLDSGRLSSVIDPAKVKDFSIPVDLNNLGTTALFGPLQ